jgi:hypothetical protein
MPNKNSFAAAALIVLVTQSAEASTIAFGSVDWHFAQDATLANLPPITGLNIIQGRFGGPYEQTTGDFDATGTASTALGESMGTVRHDAVTGSYDFDLVASSPAPDMFVAVLGGSLHNRYSVTTDVLRFSYDYSYFAIKNDPLDNLSFNVQVEVLSGEDTWYTDYRPEHETFNTNRAVFQSAGAAGVASFDEHGTRWFEFGQAGVFRDWVIRTDMNFSANDDRQPLNVPEPSSLLIFGAGLLGLATTRRARPTAEPSK